MTLFPRLSLDWPNGWILLVIYATVFGAVVKSFPQEVVDRLYDRSHWTPRQRRLTLVGKALSFALFVLVALSPLRIGRPIFVVGIIVFVLGLIGVVVALFNFKAAPPGQPATTGLYTVSRNPQWVMLMVTFIGSCLAVGSWTAVLLAVLAAVIYHVRILAEERSCLAHYGETYRAYMERIPRYFVFF
jgi:protein-S-isoprenylcysteine O-methyltransferase Ste14